MSKSLSIFPNLPLIMCLVLNFSYLLTQTNSKSYEDFYHNVTVTRWGDPNGSKTIPYQEHKNKIIVTPFKSNRIYQQYDIVHTTDLAYYCEKIYTKK